MLLVDANVLLYATDRSASLHDRSRSWLDDALSGAEPVGFCWLVLTAFLRLSTHAAVYRSPLRPERAVDVVEAWLMQPPAVTVQPSASHLAELRPLLVAAGTGGNLVNDAHLAAIAREHGATIVSYDRDFGRFAGVRWQLPS